MGIKKFLTNIFGKKEAEISINCPYKMSPQDWALRIERFNDCLSHKFPWKIASFSSKQWPSIWRDRHVGILIRKQKDVRNMLARIRKAILKTAEARKVHKVIVELAGVQHNVDNLLYFYIEIAGVELLLGNNKMLEPLAGMACGNLPEQFSSVKTKLREATRMAYNTVREVIRPLIKIPRCLDQPDSREAKRLLKFSKVNKKKLEFDYVAGFYKLKTKKTE